MYVTKKKTVAANPAHLAKPHSTCSAKSQKQVVNSKVHTKITGKVLNKTLRRPLRSTTYIAMIVPSIFTNPNGKLQKIASLIV